MIPVIEVQKGESLAVRRTVYIPMRKSTDYVSPQPTFSAATALISTDGAAVTATSNAIAAVTNSVGFAKLELALTEIADVGVRLITVNQSGAFGQLIVRVVLWDPYTAGAMTDRQLRQKRGGGG